MSIDTPQFRRALEEADFLKERLFKLQERVVKTDDLDSYLDYLHTLYALIDKEHCIYTRLKLIGTEEALAAISVLDGHKVLTIMGDNVKDVSVGQVYPEVKKELIDLIRETSGDDWDPEDFDIDDEDW